MTTRYYDMIDKIINKQNGFANKQGQRNKPITTRIDGPLLLLFLKVRRNHCRK